jgi:hypothetical protein
MNDDDWSPWNPPYVDYAAEHEAQVRWIANHAPDAIPPWVDPERDDRPAPPFEPTRPVVLRPRTAEEKVDAAIAKVRAKPEPPPPPLPPLPPSPIPSGARVRVLTGPVNDYGRGETRDGVVRGWDGALVIQLDGFTETRRFHASRVSAFHHYWTDMLLDPAKVTWVRGDAPPPLPPPPHGSKDPIGEQLKAEREDAFSVAVQPLPVVSRPIYPGILG